MTMFDTLKKQYISFAKIAEKWLAEPRYNFTKKQREILQLAIKHPIDNACLSTLHNLTDTLEKNRKKAHSQSSHTQREIDEKINLSHAIQHAILLYRYHAYWLTVIEKFSFNDRMLSTNDCDAMQQEFLQNTEPYQSGLQFQPSKQNYLAALIKLLSILKNQIMSWFFYLNDINKNGANTTAIHQCQHLHKHMQRQKKQAIVSKFFNQLGASIAQRQQEFKEFYSAVCPHDTAILQAQPHDDQTPQMHIRTLLSPLLTPFGKATAQLTSEATQYLTSQYEEFVTRFDQHASLHLSRFEKELATRELEHHAQKPNNQIDALYKSTLTLLKPLICYYVQPNLKTLQSNLKDSEAMESISQVGTTSCTLTLPSIHIPSTENTTEQSDYFKALGQQPTSQAVTTTDTLGITSTTKPVNLNKTVQTDEFTLTEIPQAVAAMSQLLTKTLDQWQESIHTINQFTTENYSKETRPHIAKTLNQLRETLIATCQDKTTTANDTALINVINELHKNLSQFIPDSYQPQLAADKNCIDNHLMMVEKRLQVLESRLQSYQTLKATFDQLINPPLSTVHTDIRNTERLTADINYHHKRAQQSCQPLLNTLAELFSKIPSTSKQSATATSTKIDMTAKEVYASLLGKDSKLMELYESDNQTKNSSFTNLEQHLTNNTRRNTHKRSNHYVTLAKPSDVLSINNDFLKLTQQITQTLASIRAQKHCQMIACIEHIISRELTLIQDEKRRFNLLYITLQRAKTEPQSLRAFKQYQFAQLLKQIVSKLKNHYIPSQSIDYSTPNYAISSLLTRFTTIFDNKKLTRANLAIAFQLCGTYHSDSTIRQKKQALWENEFKNIRYYTQKDNDTFRNAYYQRYAFAPPDITIRTDLPTLTTLYKQIMDNLRQGHYLEDNDFNDIIVQACNAIKNALIWHNMAVLHHGDEIFLQTNFGKQLYEYKTLLDDQLYERGDNRASIIKQRYENEKGAERKAFDKIYSQAPQDNFSEIFGQYL